jgi:nicotinamidase-related amidase
MTPDASSTAIVVVDIQEKFVPAIGRMADILPKIKTLLSAAKELKVPVMVTEQYPKGLGRTIPELLPLLPEGFQPLEKTSFSCFGAEGFRTELSKSPVKSLVLIGIETHICLLQTAVHALERGYEVFLVADCVASRNDFDRDIALAFMAKAGVRIVSAESLIFMLLKDASNPAFRAVSKLIK